MIKKIRIQNFRNLKDVTVHLNEVNLFIGPNNSGKSNVLQAIRLASCILQRNLLERKETVYSDLVQDTEYDRQLDSIGLKAGENCILSFIIRFPENIDHEIFLQILIRNSLPPSVEIYWGITETKDIRMEKLEEDIKTSGICFFFLEIPSSLSMDSLAPFDYASHSVLFKSMKCFSMKRTNFIESAADILGKFINFPIYEISPKEMRLPYGTTGDKYLKKDGSNIVSFLDYLKDNQEDIYAGLKESLSLITKDFQGFRLEALRKGYNEIKSKFSSDTIKRFGLIDRKNKDNTIWGEYLSDGILYFLALLCVVSQPYSPPVLLLEEPEKGIHPRRIQEVMDLLFALAEEKKVQIILTTHSTFVLDQFSDFPENISVFENHDSVITVKNLKKDVLEKIDADFKEQGYANEDFTEALGENWALGLLGGIPG
ncbi:MAG TPA: AAA family ATPase [Leptospiraceae bacterium]|nr:AAA family ATPase [Leptospiraceae bacterium]